MRSRSASMVATILCHQPPTIAQNMDLLGFADSVLTSQLVYE